MSGEPDEAPPGNDTAMSDHEDAAHTGELDEIQADVETTSHGVKTEEDDASPFDAPTSEGIDQTAQALQVLFEEYHDPTFKKLLPLDFDAIRAHATTCSLEVLLTAFQMRDSLYISYQQSGVTTPPQTPTKTSVSLNTGNSYITDLLKGVTCPPPAATLLPKIT